MQWAIHWYARNCFEIAQIACTVDNDKNYCANMPWCAIVDAHIVHVHNCAKRVIVTDSVQELHQVEWWQENVAGKQLIILE